MDRASTEFYKNVLLLTRFVEPHSDFKKHFKEGMFDKPNSPGFIHVSFYLLSVHYKAQLKTKIQWPITCKQTENKFRKDVRECLMVIANENSDVNFPPILASHLLLAKGSKFLLIMWKFSLVVLRTYLQREHNCILTSNPKTGPCLELTKTFLKKVAADHCDTVSDLKKDRENLEIAKRSHEKRKNQEINELKAMILKLKEKLKQVTIDAPVNEAVRMRFLNPEDNEIISMWFDTINQSISDLQEKNESLKDVVNRLSYIVNIVQNLTGNSLKLNSSNFDKINVEPIYKLLPPDKQVLVCNLYQKDNLNLQNLFAIAYLLFQKYASNVHKNEFSKCNLQLQMSNKDLKIAINNFQTLPEEIQNFTFVNNLTFKCKNDDSSELLDTSNIISHVDNVLFLPSPSIQINNCKGEREKIQNHLQLTPVEGAHKQLFSRHATNNENDAYSIRRKPMPVMHINFEDTPHEMSSEKLSMTQRFNRSSKLEKFNLKYSEKYSRLGSVSSFIPSHSRVNQSMMTIIPDTDSSMIPLKFKQHCMSFVDTDNSSQEFLKEPLLMNPNLNCTGDESKPEEEEANVSQTTNKRRSISDLVERYKKLLQNRDTQSQERMDPTTEQSEVVP